MALIKCPECGKEVSDKAKVCQNCGIDIVDNILCNEPKKKKKRLKTIILVIALALLGGVAYWGLKIVPEKQAERDKAIYNEIVQNLEDSKYKTAIGIIKEGLSEDNKNKVIVYTKNVIKSKQINSINDISQEKLHLYQNYLNVLENIDAEDSASKKLVCNYLNTALKLEEYSDYFPIIKYYNSSDYTVRDNVLETALGSRDLNPTNLKAGIDLLDSIDMSKYDSEGYGISDIIEANQKERNCYNKLLQYAYGDTSVNPTAELEKLVDIVTPYAEVIANAVSVANDEIKPIINSLPTL